MGRSVKYDRLETAAAIQAETRLFREALEKLEVQRMVFEL